MVSYVRVCFCPYVLTHCVLSLPLMQSKDWWVESVPPTVVSVTATTTLLLLIAHQEAKGDLETPQTHQGQDTHTASM